MQLYSKAVSAFTSAIKLDAQRTDTWFNLGLCHSKLADYDKAIDALCEAHRLAPQNINTLINLGSAYQLSDQQLQAVDIYQQATQIAPNQPMAFSKLVSGHLQLADPESAMKVCDGYLATHPNDPSLLACKAIVHGELNQEKEQAHLYDYERLIQPVQLSVPTGYESINDFNREIAAHVKAHPSLNYSPGEHATRNGFHSNNLLTGNKGPLIELERQIIEAIDGYKQWVGRDQTHPYLASPMPEKYEIYLWAVVMKKQGHQIPHIHPTSWLSGCYYAKVPAEFKVDDPKKEGWIEFGAAPDGYPCVRPNLIRAYLPKEGHMNLFPSYFYHRTVPYDVDEERISLAFDIIPIS